MKILVFGIILGVGSCLHAQGLGRSEPPYVEATATMPFKLINNAEKRCDMVSDLAEKSEMNYRLLALRVMEKWQSSMKADKDFLKNLRQYKTVAFTVHKDGSIAISGVEDPPSGKKANKSGGNQGSAKTSAVPANAGSDK